MNGVRMVMLGDGCVCCIMKLMMWMCWLESVFSFLVKMSFFGLMGIWKKLENFSFVMFFGRVGNWFMLLSLRVSVLVC